MAFVKKTWLARLGQGLNKFILNGGSRVTLESSPDTVTQQGTPLSAENMNDLEDRIDSEFTNVNDAINAISGDMIHYMKAQAYQETGKLTDNIRTLIANGNWMGFFLAIETMTGLPTNDPCFVLYFRTFGSSEVVVLAFNMTSNVMYMKLTHATTDYDFTEWSSI